MIRERRNKTKLKVYYDKFVKEGVIDPNVHPWVAESWQRSENLGVGKETFCLKAKLSEQELAGRREKYGTAISFLDGLYEEIKEHFTTYNLSMLLLDQNIYVLKNYAMPFYQKTAGELEGARLGEEDVGTSSVSIAYKHRVPFLMFGPEMWIRDCQSGDACTVPIIVDNQVKFMVTVVSVQQDELPYSAMVAMVLSIKYAMEQHLKVMASLTATHTILDAVPLAVYHIFPGGEVAYANKLGQSRLSGIVPPGNEDREEGPNLSNVLLNYRHTPLYRGFLGVPSYNREVTWITPRKTYEDITTVVPLRGDDNDVDSIVAVSLPIEDLRTLVAHTAGYTARYSLSSLVGVSNTFTSMLDKAGRMARHDYHLLLQGEPGTGKQRLAHGIHQASSRAAGPLIAVRIGDTPSDVLEMDLFGRGGSEAERRPGKLELANGGTLFLDEVEKLSAALQEKLADALEANEMSRSGETVARPIDVRVIAACDSDLKKLVEKGVFSARFYEIISHAVVRVPPLRARRDDVPGLANHIIEELAALHNLPAKYLEPEAAELIMSYDWPGNIKQLQGVMEQAFFRTTGTTITRADIVMPGERGLSKAWKEDKAAFIEVWKAAGGNISRLANMLDVSRVTLYRYLKKYGLDKD
ncbi:sigma 54-interacting transcriptional regulator [Sporomusa acidovorans]|uniref:Anaerobic nitric oxide reductase transcription regulator NorR n=1 Tax=Sporomusa acidovorans (strain ATCC 49682 / DSM 3132 / Mol) TaxID=1123286 RepID=A0ABZ3JBA8_SPOA4|nr:sigma 54-interacting transcriptional regulator [Sporomusa acidovorans]OZC13284.1 arginine utilization regulatory protein RocR [Sporomusa acidovorans DSM 3132]SDD98231.1 regulatory protein, Fis family [Sporomusa acidovorans]